MARPGLDWQIVPSDMNFSLKKIKKVLSTQVHLCLGCVRLEANSESINMKNYHQIRNLGIGLDIPLVLHLEIEVDKRKLVKIHIYKYIYI